MQKTDEKTLALAAIVQCCQQVRSIALKGQYDSKILETAIHSVLATRTDNTLEVYGSISSINNGLHYIKNYHLNQSNHDIEQTKYIILSLALSKKLMKNSTMMNDLADKIEQITVNKEQYGQDNSIIIEKLADLYQQTISQLSPRILVTGNADFLSQKSLAGIIRTFLFASIRSAVLWNQLGGSRWQLLFKRQQFIDSAAKTLKQIY